MAKTYCMCQGMRGEATRRGGNDGCMASVQAWDGSVCIRNWYDGDQLKVRVGTNDYSSCYSNNIDFVGTYEEFKDLLKLAAGIKSGKVSVVRHREKSNKQLTLERAVR